MPTKGSQVLEEALSLPPAERAEIAERLLSSLDPPTQAALDSLWAEEAEDRIDAFESGEIRAIPVSRVFQHLPKNIK